MFRTPCWCAFAVVMFLLTSPSILCAADPVRASGEVAWSGSLVSAWRTAREQQRPLFVFVTMDSCAHCQKMKQVTFKDTQIQGELKARFVPVTLNVEDEPDFVKILRIRSFPTLVVIQPNGDVVESMSGYQTPKQLREKLSVAVRQATHEKAGRSAR